MKIQVFSWLFLIPLFWFFLACKITSVSGQCLENQRSLLLQLKEGLKFNSSASTKLVNWNKSTKDCCEWGGVVCDKSSGYVIGLELDGETIYAGINSSSSLYKFQHLQKLNLAYNNFAYTEIPSGLITLTNLRYLNLSNCGFSGQIPEGFSRMTRLDVLDLSCSHCYELGMPSLKIENPNLKMIVQNLKELTELYMDGVNMTAEANSWSETISTSLPNLKVLSLSDTLISGSIIPLERLNFLSHLHLDTNNLNDTVLEFLANLTNLKVLGLSYCNLQGIFPKRIMEIPTLEFLDLSNNQNLQGSLPEFPENGSLRTLLLAFTKFSGGLPKSIGNLDLLSRMEIDNCNFSGVIPYSIGNLTRLVHLDFSYNNLSGHIPLLENSTNLVYLDLSHNRLSGTIPSTYFEGPINLLHVDLGFNVFTGRIPTSLFALQLLQKISLSGNQFSGSLANLGSTTWSQLHTLDLSSNRLNGSIPMSIFELKGLNILSLSFNCFTGTLLLETIQRLESLTNLDLSYNNLSIETNRNSSGETLRPQFGAFRMASCKLKLFPNLRNQSGLSILDLSDNQIGGEIPSWIWNRLTYFSYLNLSQNQLVSFQDPYAIPQILVLDLHSNQLSGKIPVIPKRASYVDYSANNFSSSISDDIGKNLSIAYFFSISSNKLTGTIPDSICEGFYLKVLDLSNNGLSGVIPSCLLGRTESLAILNIGNNNLSGHIDGTFVRDCSFRTLDLHGNHLEGNVPRSLSNCTMLEVLNLGHNQISDTFPCFLKNISNLRVLVLRSNLFHGEIRCPESENHWPNLQILDIALNDFRGEIPPNFFVNWTAMIDYDDNAHLETDHLRYMVSELTSFYYQDTVTLTNKGQEVTLVKILTIFNSIDMFSNQFVGNIPETMGKLKVLHLLNLSHNAFTGSIPSSFGNLKQLEALDLSANKINGIIPRELGSLTFLSFLNLSYNQLNGKIPVAPQFSTFGEEAFIGNKGLCGAPLKITCVEAKADPPLGFDGHWHPKTKVEWDMIAAEVGFSVGLGIIIMPLIFYRRWRMIYYEHIDAALSWIIKNGSPSKKTKKI